jgi:hypothetical protein
MAPDDKQRHRDAGDGAGDAARARSRRLLLWQGPALVLIASAIDYAWGGWAAALTTLGLGIAAVGVAAWRLFGRR